MECPLCRLYERGEVLTKLYFEDDVCVVVDCASHPTKKLCVLKRHSSEPTPEEKQHMRLTMQRLFPNIQLRMPRSILDHWHLHEV